MNLMRSMDYQPAMPTGLDGNPMQSPNMNRYKMWEIVEKIGQG